MGHVMPEYRIYELDDQRQPFKPPWIATWKDDIAAQICTRALLGRHALEIWCGERKVATIEPDL
jgi:hypothetical protein